MLPAFWEACQPYMAAELRDTYDAAAMRDFATGVQACEDQDPVELLEVLYERVQSGCVLRTVGVTHDYTAQRAYTFQFSVLAQACQLLCSTNSDSLKMVQQPNTS